MRSYSFLGVPLRGILKEFMENKILKLTKLWYEYVGMDHHKDCDWYVNKVWSYGAKPYYRIEHHGYIYTSANGKHYKTYAAAEKELYREIRKAFMLELEWVRMVLARPKEYDSVQIEKAKWLIENFKEC